MVLPASTEKHINRYKNYIKKLNLNQDIEKAIINDDFINNNPEFYLYYPQLFSTVFDTKKEDLALLCIAGYLYYQSTILLDSVIDEKELHKIIYVTTCQEEAIKILTSIYGKDSVFWSYWKQRRDEYFAAIQLEKSIHTKENISIDDYLKIADYKSAFGKAAIDALFVSGKSSNKETYQSLLKSHQLFSLAYQLNDDILDFKVDFISGQFNWVHHLLKQESNVESTDINVLNKYIYIRGITSKVFKIAIDYLNKSLKVIEDIDVPVWKATILDLRKKFKTSIVETENYLEVLRSEVSSVSKYVINNDLANSIALSVNYIKHKQNIDGSWRESIHQRGISNVWATALILSNLPGQLIKNDLSKEVANALAFLQKSRIQKLWGYDPEWIEDADTTNFVLLSYLNNNIDINKADVIEWNKYRTKDGGIRTYKDKRYLLKMHDDKYITDFSGWCSSHPCVSAASFYFITKYNPNSSTFFSLKQYFNVLSEKEDYSYWWTSPIYTWYYLAKTYSLLGDDQKTRQLVQKLMEYRNEDGSFSDLYGKNFFYTGMGLDIMLNHFDDYQQEIEITVGFLLKNQYEDGSWANSHPLQLPDPASSIPKNFPYALANYGTNVRAKEFNRLFTTSFVLHALYNYNRKRGIPNT